ncbi:MAG: hypothetical protein A2Y10_05785 [Planctomycetes bacterium GWF2_41_51]|nr:MAG: hypothetical protein A2Y10_05785 [Planctomycetes bacterium GWF2_41_51]
MSSDVVLSVRNIGKRYEIYKAPHHRLLQTLLHGRKKFYDEFWALRDVSFDVKPGECVGIIGRNGSGKSTLLQIIAGTLSPTTGSVSVDGKIAALLELGSGFSPEFTGRENAYLNGAIQGFSKTDMDKKIDEIAAFADIGDFFDQPIKKYSSGMYVRLAFAAAISIDPSILIIDEALSVGDIRFQQKCLRKLKEFINNGKTILFVSHDISSVKIFCDRVIWLDNGKVQSSGDPEKVTKEYFSFMTYDLESKIIAPEEKLNNSSSTNSVSYKEIQWETTAQCQSFGEGGAVILATSLYSKTRGEPIKTFKGGEDVCYYVKIKASRRIELPIVGFILSDDHGVQLLGYNSHNLGLKLMPVEAEETKIFRLEFQFPRLMAGVYFFSPAIADGTMLTHTQQHWVHDAYTVQIVNMAEIAHIGCYFIPEAAFVFEEC